MEKILTIKPSSLTELQMGKVNRLASLGFEQTEAKMYQDTKTERFLSIAAKNWSR